MRSCVLGYHGPMKPSELMKNPFHLTFGEEVGNAVSHGVMMFLLLFALPFASVHAFLQEGWLEVWGVGIYMICMIFMFGGSCLYHIMPYDTMWKTVFRKLDHISITLAIAGTYTPICLVVVGGWIGWAVLITEWVLAIVMILIKSISSKAWPKLSMTIYMIMGWLAVLILPTIISKGGWLFFGLILAGGVCYTIGAFFYKSHKPYAHFIWHLFIIAASILHLIAILFFM